MSQMLECTHIVLLEDKYMYSKYIHVLYFNDDSLQFNKQG